MKHKIVNIGKGNKKYITLVSYTDDNIECENLISCYKLRCRDCLLFHDNDIQGVEDLEEYDISEMDIAPLVEYLEEGIRDKKEILGDMEETTRNLAEQEEALIDYMNACDKIELCDKFLADKMTIDEFFNELGEEGCPYDEYHYDDNFIELCSDKAFDKWSTDKEKEHKCIMCWRESILGKENK